MNSRLLHAAARGARIESIAYGGDWFETNVFIQGQDERIVQYRIHPSDEHLAYGPVSTALRESEKYVLQSDIFPALGVHAAMSCRLDHMWMLTWRNQSAGDRALALLILAEDLADEGL